MSTSYKKHKIQFLFSLGGFKSVVLILTRFPECWGQPVQVLLIKRFLSQVSFTGGPLIWPSGKELIWILQVPAPNRP